MKHLAGILIVSLIFFSDIVCGQDTLRLLNGKSKSIEAYDVKDPEWVFYKLSNDRKHKMRRIDSYKVFAVSKSDGGEEIIYAPDTANGDPSISWVRDFIKGQQYGALHKREHFNKHDGAWHNKINFNEVGGLVVGGGGSLLSFYGIPVPAIYALAVGRTNSKLPPDPNITPDLKNSEGFLYGYQKQRRNQRIRQGFVSSMIGFAVGIVAFTIIENQ